MSDDTAQRRHAQADELIAALNRNSITNTALAAAMGAATIAIANNTKVLEEMLADDGEDHDEDCDDDHCDGSCLDDPPPKKRKRR